MSNPLKQRVLVACGSAGLRREVVGALAAGGFDVVGEAISGEEALTLIRNLAPDGVVLEDLLQGIDGLGILERFDYGRGPLFLMLLACSSEALLPLYLQRGAAYCLRLPVEPDMVAIRMRMLLGDRPERQPAPERIGSPLPEPEAITRLLVRIGVPAHLKGYRYLREAIRFVLARGGDVRGITKEIYPHLAHAYRTAPSRVERGIRHAIEVAWSRGDVAELHRLFGATVNRDRGRPTNAEMIAMLADHLQRTQQQASRSSA
jgi:two-component system, response regulator, stage 0 sporulation protein A